jgi:hypothetical protein
MCSCVNKIFKNQKKKQKKKIEGSVFDGAVKTRVV